MLQYAQSQKINVLYVSIDEYIDIIENRNAALRKLREKEFTTNLRALVREASGRNIKIQALAGNATWANSTYRYIPIRLLEYVVSYNEKSTKEERLDGIQFDIEPYAQKSFSDKNNQEEILRNYLVLADGLIKKAPAGDLRLKIGFAIPIWYDNQTRDLPLVAWKDRRKPVGEHLFDILNKYNGSYVAIMDYRNKPEGKNGAIAHANHEFIYAAKYAPQVKIIIGQETDNIMPSHITFYGMNKVDLKDAVSKIEKAFRGYDQLQGFAIHDFDSYRSLKE